MNRTFRNLIVRAPNWLGDSVMATPVVRALRRAYPDAQLTVLTRAPLQTIWAGLDGVDRVKLMDRKGAHQGFGGLMRLAGELRAEKYDAGLLLVESFSSAFLLRAAGIPNRLGYSAEGRSLFLSPSVKNPLPRSRHWVVEGLDLLRRGWGLDPFREPARLEFPRTPLAEKEVDRLLKLAGSPQGPWVAFAPGATYGPTKRWPLANWIALADTMLRYSKVHLALVGSREEAESSEAILRGLAPSLKGRAKNFAGKTSLLGLGALLGRCRTLVTNDTGPMHVSAGVGTTVVAVFGSTSPPWTRPLGTGHRVIYKRVPCSPCYLKQCPIDLRCLTGIRPEDAWRELQPLLKGKPVRVVPEKLSPEQAQLGAS